MGGERSSRREVRNPILALPEAKAIMALPAEQREALAVLLKGLARHARDHAEYCWETRKPPMAGYWAASAVWAKHIAHALRRPIDLPAETLSAHGVREAVRG